MARGGRSGLLRLAMVYTALVASLCVVVWRQSRAMDGLRGVDGLRREYAVLVAERVDLARTLERLESRSRIVAFARTELDMHIPATREVVVMPLPRGGLLASDEGSRDSLLASGEVPRGGLFASDGSNGRAERTSRVRNDIQVREAGLLTRARPEVQDPRKSEPRG